MIPTGLVEPYLAAGTVLGSLYLRAQARVEIPARSDKADRAFAYDLFVGRDTSIFPTTWTVGMELNGENDEIALTPQIRKRPDPDGRS